MLVSRSNLKYNTNIYSITIFLYFQLVGGEFDIESNFVIQEASNILYMLSVVEQCPDNLKVSFYLRSHCSIIGIVSTKILKICFNVMGQGHQ